MNGRTYLKQKLEESFPTWKVIPFDRTIDAVPEPTVLFFRTNVQSLPEAPIGSWAHTHTLYVLSPKQVGEEALDDLDTLLDELLAFLDLTPGITWSDAEYQVLSETLPTFRITAVIRTKKED